jgi:hypothetical protein
MPAGPVRQVILPAARPAGCFPCRTGPAGRYSQFSGAPPHTTSVARLPGRNSGQKAQKGPQKKKFLAEFWLILPKTGRKGAAENFQNKFLIFSCWPNFLDVLAGNFFGTWQHCTQLGFAVPARPADLPQGGGGGDRGNGSTLACNCVSRLTLFHYFIINALYIKNQI